MIPFVKMHGLGNDFVILSQKYLYDYPLKNVKLIKSISDRQVGIGCDQVISYSVTDNANDYNMIIYNADGSSAEACGNGTRCLAWLICFYTKKKYVSIVSGGRVLSCVVKKHKIVSVNMGKASFSEFWMPCVKSIRLILKKYLVDIHDVVCVDVSNPHLVIIYKSCLPQDLNLLCGEVNSYFLCTNGVNISFVKVLNNQIMLQVWERGVGLSLCCGTAACAAFAVVCKLSLISNKDGAKNIRVFFKLGFLEINFTRYCNIIMSGKVERVFQGRYYYLY